VITFNRATSTLLPLTSDPGTINSALSQTPPTAPGTHIYDAALEGIQQLHDHGIAAGTVIVLSDGADFGSTTTLQTVSSAAAADHVAVYTVGVRNRSFDGSTLQGLAQRSAGAYTASNAGGLAGVFSRIESHLTNVYLVRYDSAERLGRHVTVTVRVDGVPGTWTGSYTTPHAPVPVVGQHSQPTVPSKSFWASTLALVLVALGCAVILVGGLLVHLVPRTRQHDLRSRIGHFTLDEQAEPEFEDAARGGVTEHAESWLERFRWWPRFKEEVDVAAIERPAAEVLLLTVAIIVTLCAALSLAVGSVLISLPVLLAVPPLMWSIVRARADRQRREFAEQLPHSLDQVSSAMRAGHSVIVAIGSMADQAVDPTRREFQGALIDEQLGLPLDAALRPIARRMACPDIQQLGLVATLNQRTGGNMAEVLELIAEGARERADLRREIRTLTSQARMSRWIVTALPPAVLGLLLLIRPTYLSPLIHTTAGIIVLCVATGLVLLGSFVMRLLVPEEG
jgi:tight adherence protein B